MTIFHNRTSLAITAASLLAFSACGDSTGSSLVAEGTVAFTYAGAEAGTYNATGRFDRVRPDQGTFAVGGYGELETGGEALVVYARTPRQDERFDEFLLSVEDPQEGQQVTCDSLEDCSFGAFFFLGADVEGDSEAIYTSVSGTLTITSINEDRARGQFTFQMELLDFGEDPPTVQVTSGTFDVPIVPGVY